MRTNPFLTYAVSTNHTVLSPNTATKGDLGHCPIAQDLVQAVLTPCHSTAPPWLPGDVAQVVISSAAVFLAILALVLKYYARLKTLMMNYKMVWFGCLYLFMD